MTKKGKVIAVVQARTGSSRLPGKTMKEICGKPMILLMLERLSKSKLIDKIIVATTTKSEDDVLFKTVTDAGFDVFRGSELDCLDRHYQVGKLFNGDYICKITSDDPLIDPILTDQVIQYFLTNSNKFDYVSNVHPPTYPDGLDVEIFQMSALEKAWNESKDPNEREHTTPFIWSNPSIFKIGNFLRQKNENLFLTHRWSVDYPEDFEFVKNIFEELYPRDNNFTTDDILELLEKKPQLKEINCKFLSKNKIH